LFALANTSFERVEQRRVRSPYCVPMSVSDLEISWGRDAGELSLLRSTIQLCSLDFPREADEVEGRYVTILTDCIQKKDFAKISRSILHAQLLFTRWINLSTRVNDTWMDEVSPIHKTIHKLLDSVSGSITRICMALHTALIVVWQKHHFQSLRGTVGPWDWSPLEQCLLLIEHFNAVCELDECTARQFVIYVSELLQRSVDARITHLEQQRQLPRLVRQFGMFWTPGATQQKNAILPPLFGTLGVLKDKWRASFSSSGSASAPTSDAGDGGSKATGAFWYEFSDGQRADGPEAERYELLVFLFLCLSY